MKKLKPVTFVNAPYKGIKSTTQNTYQQVMLLKAMAVTNDPKKLREMIGVKSVADVYRTLDKLAMRKEYHKALSKLGIDFDYIVSGIKNICETADKDDTRLKGYQTLLKSLGLDAYKDEEVADSAGWEEVLMKTMNKGDKKEKVIEAELEEYDVKIPEIPESVKKQRAIEAQEGKSLYE